MRRLFIADVHANLPALEAVLRDAGPVDEVVFLGDIVGYGPHPAACVDLLGRLGARAIRGNHDTDTLADPAFGPPDPTSAHAVWRHWTCCALSSALRPPVAGRLAAGRALHACARRALASASGLT